jgi:serine/threonine protein kinase
MVTKRKATTGVPPSTAHVVKRARKVGVQRNPAFVWKSREWKVRNKPQDNLEILCHRDSAQYLVVKKIIKLNDDPLDRRPSEVAALDMLPECNRIVKTIAYEEGSPDPDHGLAFFQYYPLGDIYHWKEHSFDRFNFKPVPESYIWRFFIHMAQALAFIQNVVGPNRDSRDIMIHRDIKPKNVLVYYRQGSTYPSFKLHDFGCETRYSAHRVQKASRCGTFEWQPPEVL